MLPSFSSQLAFGLLGVANLWGYIRKDNRVDAIIRSVTYRDWYPSVAFRFYKENIDRLIEIRRNGETYLGILYSAPDRKDDNYIIIREPCLVKEVGGKMKMIPIQSVSSIVFKLDEISMVRAYKDEHKSSISKKVNDSKHKGKGGVKND